MYKYSNYVLTVFAASTIAVGAWLKFNLGPVPYTLQNYGVVLSALLLSPARAASAILIYIAMIAVGLPVGAGFSGGPHILFGYTAGYIWGFLASAPLISILARAYLKHAKVCLSKLRKRDIVSLTVIASIGVLPTYILGYLVFRHYALASSSLFNWASATSRFVGFYGSSEIVLLIASVAVFLPQDILIDHLLAVYTSSKLYSLLVSRGVLPESSYSC
ncbi:MAG: biotin transporter BioY [Sulfolobales archaeon]|nr:biotin transporter BioY [Sulfolobales archaeon]